MSQPEYVTYVFKKGEEPKDSLKRSVAFNQVHALKNLPSRPFKFSLGQDVVDKHTSNFIGHITGRAEYLETPGEDPANQYLIQYQYKDPSNASPIPNTRWVPEYYLSAMPSVVREAKQVNP